MTVDLRNSEINDNGWPFIYYNVLPVLAILLVVIVIWGIWQWKSERYKRWFPFLPIYLSMSDRGLWYRELIAILAPPLAPGEDKAAHLLKNLKRTDYEILEQLRAFRRHSEDLLNQLNERSNGFGTNSERKGYFYIWHADKDFKDWFERTVDSEATRAQFNDLNTKIAERDREIALNKTAATDAATEITALKEKVKELNLAATKATTDHAAALKVVTDERDALKAAPAPATASSPDEVKKLQAKIDRLTKERDKLKGEIKGLTAARP